MLLHQLPGLLMLLVVVVVPERVCQSWSCLLGTAVTCQFCSASHGQQYKT
jgi:hypothetical protein